MSTPSEGDYSNTSQRTIINPSQYSVHLRFRQPDSLKNSRNCKSISDLFYHFHSGGTSSLCDHFDTLIMHTQLNIPNKPLSVSTTPPARFSEAPVLRHDTAIARVHGSDIRYARLRVRRVLHLRQSEWRKTMISKTPLPIWRKPESHHCDKAPKPAPATIPQTRPAWFHCKSKNHLLPCPIFR